MILSNVVYMTSGVFQFCGIFDAMTIKCILIFVTNWLRLE